MFGRAHVLADVARGGARGRWLLGAIASRGSTLGAGKPVYKFGTSYGETPNSRGFLRFCTLGHGLCTRARGHLGFGTTICMAPVRNFCRQGPRPGGARSYTVNDDGTQIDRGTAPWFGPFGVFACIGGGAGPAEIPEEG